MFSILLVVKIKVERKQSVGELNVTAVNHSGMGMSELGNHVPITKGSTDMAIPIPIPIWS